MGGILYIIGISLAGYAGYNGFQWYFIFISSVIMAMGYFIIRAPQIRRVIADDGIVAIPRFLAIYVVIYSIITAPVYFIGIFLN